VGQWQDIVSSLPQWRKAQRKDAHPVVEVGPEPSTRYFLFEVTVAGCDKTGDTALSLVAAQGFIFAGLDYSQQHCLLLKPNGVDLIQDNGAVPYGIELTESSSLCPRESPSSMTEKLTPSQARVHGPTGDSQKTTPTSRRRLVDEPSQPSLAGARLPCEQYGDIMADRQGEFPGHRQQTGGQVGQVAANLSLEIGTIRALGSMEVPRDFRG
jgi:hypothetical protein